MLKSRKRMLLSSIAMLLVALVALGSATFAWYYTQQQVTASTTSWKASTADGLVIRHEVGQAWATSINTLAHSDELTPASINYAATLANTFGATGQSADRDSSALSGPLTGKAITAENSSYFLIDSFYVASNSETNQMANFIVKGSTNSTTYLNLAIYVNGKLAKVMTSDADAAEKVVGQVDGTVSSPTAKTTGDDLQTLTKLGSSVNIGIFNAQPKGTSLSNAGGTKIDIIGFADGFNTKCKSSLANNTAVEVTYEFNTVTSGTVDLGV